MIHASLTVHTEPTAEPIEPSDLKAQLRITHDEEDLLLQTLIRTARQYCEDDCRRSFVTQTLRLSLSEFPGWQVTLPRAPVQSITSIIYVDVAGETQTLSSSRYQLDSRADPAIVVPAWSQDWPGVRCQPNAVEILYVAGYGGPTAVPEPIRHAIRLVAGHLYQHREANTESDLPPNVGWLLGPYRLLEVP